MFCQIMYYYYCYYLNCYKHHGPWFTVQMSLLCSSTQLCIYIFCLQLKKVNLQTIFTGPAKTLAELKCKTAAMTAQWAGDVHKPPESSLLSTSDAVKACKSHIKHHKNHQMDHINLYWCLFLWGFFFFWGEYFIDNSDCSSNAPFCHCPTTNHVFAGNESSILDGLLRVQPKTQNAWINEALHVSHCAVRPQTARQSMMLLLFLAKVDFVVYWIWHEPLMRNF